MNRPSLIALGLCLAFCCAAAAQTWKVEAELSGDGDGEKFVPGISKDVIRYKALPADDASGGLYMGGNLNESKPIPTRIPRAGAYRVWVRHYQTVGKPTSFFILFRDDRTAGVGLRYIDFHPRAKNLTALPTPLPEAPADAKPAWTWSVCDYTFERPMEASIVFGNGGGLSTGKLGIDCVVITDQTGLDPRKDDWSSLPGEPGPLQPVTLPSGLTPALPLVLHSSFFAGDPDRAKQIKLTMVHGYTLYRDFPLILTLGFNRDRGHVGGSVEFGVQTQVSPGGAQYYATQDLLKKVPPPEGRRVGADGKVRDTRFSLAYEPYRKMMVESLREGLTAYQDMPEVERYCTVGESGGVFDYSDHSRADFHRWLERKYGSIQKLNERWRTEYPSFSDVVLPKAPTPGSEQNKAAWFAFRDYSSKVMCEQFAEEVRAVNEVDKHGRQATSQASCLHINSPWFTSTGPLDFEDLITIGFKDSKLFGYDAYSSEDGFVGCDLELLLSLAGDKEVLNGESNTHAQDPRIAARSYWAQIGKGVKGIDIWQLQDHPINWVYSMWGMLKADMTPRDKLGAVADANHEIHRVERMLRPAQRQRFVKPVALYYSRMDLSLSQPLFDIYGAAINSPYRVYEVLRGLGYPVRWITPRQIEAGELTEVGAVCLVGVKYVPGEAAKKLAQWVHDGGCIIGDGWPGAFDEYDRQQGTLAQVFGIRPVEEATATMTPEEARIALGEQQTPVYAVDPKVLASLTADQFYKNVDEMFDQRDAEHPVARAVGNWHLSGYDGKHVHVVSGQIIGQMMGKPGIVINEFGRGHALYSAIMLGTLYEGAPLRFEWDSTREGPALGNILGAYLRHSGLEPFAQADLPLRMARKLRIEDPLIDAKKNVLIGMVSVNDGPLSPFGLTLAWPKNAPTPKMLLAVTGASRDMKRVPFAIQDGRMTLTMPGFDTHAMLLGINDSDPLVSMTFTGLPRAEAGLLTATPGSRASITATVWNPSPRRLAPGSLRLHAAPGWACDKSDVKIDAIEPWGSAEASFTVAAPPLCAARSLQPIVLKYESGKTTAPPATELLWWTPAAP